MKSIKSKAGLRSLVSIIVLLAIVAVLVFDGVSMYGAHCDAVAFSAEAAGQAARTYIDTDGNEQTVHQVIQDMATGQGVELVDLSYHKGTTRWYKVTVKAESGGLLLKFIPYFKDRLGQQSTTIEHF